MPVSPHVLFAGGGAPGHLFPGLAVAEHLRRRMPEAMITFAGSGRARERHAVSHAGYRYSMIPAQPKPQSPLQALRFVTDNVAGFCAARWVLREQQVSMVVGLGGYTSAAVVRSAVARGIPVVLLEQNAIPGRTTQWLSRCAARVCTGFDAVRPHLHVQAPVTLSGNPVRPAFEQLYFRNHTACGRSKVSRSTIKRLVVLGGAGGARSLNETMPKALSHLADQLRGWQVVHQTGEGQLQETEKRYRAANVQALTVSYLDELASVLFDSDLVVCRSGGTTLAELALANIPGLLVPYARSTDNHQVANAKVYTAAGATKMIDESSQGGALDVAITGQLDQLLTDDTLLDGMRSKMQKLARPQAAADVAGTVIDCLQGNVNRRMAA